MSNVFAKLEAKRIKKIKRELAAKKQALKTASQKAIPGINEDIIILLTEYLMMESIGFDGDLIRQSIPYSMHVAIRECPILETKIELQNDIISTFENAINQ